MIDPITDDDVTWVRSLMRLGELDEPRQQFLRSLETIDVAACPGSGKTTLIVAKLAILARRWRHATRGICVLSHTNVAREEIVAKLGGSAVGQRLLGYPHFIGTIHGFVNRFLATPFLLSSGYPVEVIDDDVAAAIRRRALGQRFHNLRLFLERHHSTVESIRITSADFQISAGGRAFPAGQGADMYQLARGAAMASAQAGVFCYDDIFVFGRALIAQEPQIGVILSNRFPLLLVDEMQDTSETQSEFLRALFPREAGTTVVQRVGDPNQQIFEAGTASVQDAFPDRRPGHYVSIPNSARFGQLIASRASPIAVQTVEPLGLRGLGPILTPDIQPQPTLFLFDGNAGTRVLDAFGSHVLNVLPKNVRSSRPVVAVGAIHKPADEVVPGHAHYPKTLGHYCPAYQHQVRRLPTRNPAYLCHYFLQAQSSVRAGVPFGECLNALALGMCRTAEALAGRSIARGQTRPHRYIERSLNSYSEVQKLYRQIIVKFLANGTALNELEWAQAVPHVRNIAARLGECDSENTGADELLSWAKAPLIEPVNAADGGSPVPINTYRYRGISDDVDIELGSIHSVKGQTHSATLVVETYFHGHDLQSLLPWLVGDRQNGATAGERDRKRLHQVYVAMTRPTHLLCLAMRTHALGATVADQTRQAERLEAIGWSVQRIVP